MGLGRWMLFQVLRHRRADRSLEQRHRPLFPGQQVARVATEPGGVADPLVGQRGMVADMLRHRLVERFQRGVGGGWLDIYCGDEPVEVHQSVGLGPLAERIERHRARGQRAGVSRHQGEAGVARFHGAACLTARHQKAGQVLVDSAVARPFRECAAIGGFGRLQLPGLLQGDGQIGLGVRIARCPLEGRAIGFHGLVVAPQPVAGHTQVDQGPRVARLQLEGLHQARLGAVGIIGYEVGYAQIVEQGQRTRRVARTAKGDRVQEQRGGHGTATQPGQERLDPGFTGGGGDDNQAGNLV